MLDVTAEGRVSHVLTNLGEALAANDLDRALALFQDDCYWRDLVAFTWNIKTLEGKEAVRAMLTTQLASVKPSAWAVDPAAGVTEEGGVTTGWFTFETDVFRGYGLVRLKDGKIWTLLTTAAELKGHEEPLGFQRPLGAKHGAGKHRLTWKEEREEEARTLGYTKQPYVVIVGGGQGAIGLGARLRMLGVPTIIVEKNARPGDSWRNRYKSLCLHDPVWYDHMPYLPFPPNWPVFSPKDKIGDWLEMYTKIMELNYWGSTTCKKARFDEAEKEWKSSSSATDKEITLRPKHLVLATGMSAKPNMPKFPGMDALQGRPASFLEASGAGRLCGQEGGHHRLEQFGPRHRGGAVGERRRRDDGAALLDPHRALGHADGHRPQRALLREGGEVRHRPPPRRSHLRLDPLSHPARVPDPALSADEGARRGVLRRPRKGGLLARLGPRRLGPVHEVPAPRLGLLHRRRREPARHRRQDQAQARPGRGDHRDGVKLDDGTELPADLIVYATGYGSMNGWAADLISQEVADKVGKVWGLGSDTPKDPGPWEGEQRNMWKPTQQEALWFHGGNLHQSRHYSQFLALQLKARMEGIPTPVYGLQETHHKS